MSESQPLFSSEKKIRFRSHAKVLYADDTKIEDLFKQEKDDPHSNEPETPKKGILVAPRKYCQGTNESRILEKTPSIFSFLKVELTRIYVLEHDEERYSARREKMYSFMKIPREVEKFMSYGFLQCLDSFLYVYTFLPLRVMLAMWAVITRPIAGCFRRIGTCVNALTPAEICDLLKAVILVVCSLLMFYVDTNMMYHLIKSQSIIKLYIFYNMLEVGDRLFSAFGQDTIDALLWTAAEPRGRRREHFGVIPHLVFAIVYVFLHSVLVLCQATTLNVAINSNNKALLTIMMSNNFVELKGSVFKKFDKNNLFQVSCSDVRERFHLVILLLIVGLQTMKEYAWRVDRFWVLLPDCVMVICAEILVDWIKHAFITRFNELQVDVYRDYTTSLAYDMAQTRQKHAFSDHSDLVARRMGFIPLPLGVVMTRVLVHAVHINDIIALMLSFLAFLCIASLRILNNILVLGLACYLITQHKTERASPNSNRANSPLPKARDWLKDTATSPTKPIAADLSNGLNVSSEIPISQPELLSAAIFSNSTVDLKNVSLNEELLKVEGDDIKLEAALEDGFSKSDPTLNCEFAEVTQEIHLEDGAMKKRAESEPNLTNCTDNDE